MTTSNFSTNTIGWIAVLTGACTILAVILLILMFTVNMSFGQVNDVFNALFGILSSILAWMLYMEHHVKSPLMSQPGVALAAAGAIVSMIGSILIIFGYTGFVLAGWYSGLGNALIGIWLAFLCYSLLRSDVLPHNMILFGMIAGGVMAIGLLGVPGILARVDSMDALPWYLYLAFFGWLRTYILYPIWTIWLGRYLILK